MEKIRLGLVGCGGMMAQHVQGVLMVDTVEIVATCDIVEERAKTVADALGGKAKTFTNYVDMVDMVDAVMIALPHDLHFECGTLHYKNGVVRQVRDDFLITQEKCRQVTEYRTDRISLVKAIYYAVLRLFAPLM